MKSPLQACRKKLAERLKAVCPHLLLDKNGYVDRAEGNLIEGVNLSDFEADLRQGDGNELEGKFRAAHSSSAFAVNNFAPFKNKPEMLHLLGHKAFGKPSFERKCPHGLVGRKSPNLDVLIECQDKIVAIESKCLEYLSAHTAKFADAYEREIQDSRRQSAWFAEMNRLKGCPKSYHRLDAAQLIKDAFGLLHTFPNREITLLYLFWEPRNSSSNERFAQHRAEIADFEKAVGQQGPRFVAISYLELWAYWESAEPSAWMSDHIRRLRARYDIEI